MGRTDSEKPDLSPPTRMGSCSPNRPPSGVESDKPEPPDFFLRVPPFRFSPRSSLLESRCCVAFAAAPERDFFRLCFDSAWDSDGSFSEFELVFCKGIDFASGADLCCRLEDFSLCGLDFFDLCWFTSPNAASTPLFKLCVLPLDMLRAAMAGEVGQCS